MQPSSNNNRKDMKTIHSIAIAAIAMTLATPSADARNLISKARPGDSVNKHERSSAYSQSDSAKRAPTVGVSVGEARSRGNVRGAIHRRRSLHS